MGTGTSSGVPMIGCDCTVCTSTNPKDNRLRSSVLITSPTTTIVIDATPDFRYQMLRCNNRQLDAIVFTHPHKDHIAGLDDVRAYNYFLKKAIDLYANPLTEKHIRSEFYYAFEEIKYSGVPLLNMHTIGLEPFTIGDITLQPIEVMHMRMPVYGFRIGDFTYITDANFINPIELEKIVDTKILVLNALRREKHISHFTLSEAVALAEQLQVPKVYLTHISHQLGLHNQVNTEIPSHIQLAYDGLTISI